MQVLFSNFLKRYLWVRRPHASRFVSGRARREATRCAPPQTRPAPQPWGSKGVEAGRDEPKQWQLMFLEKSLIIQELEENQDLCKDEMARRFNIPQSTLCTMLKDKHDILLSERKYQGASTCCKTNKLPPYDKLEGLLIPWFQQIRAARLQVKGIILKKKALQIVEELGMDDFTASKGWLDSFRRRHCVVACSGVTHSWA